MSKPLPAFRGCFYRMHLITISYFYIAVFKPPSKISLALAVRSFSSLMTLLSALNPSIEESLTMKNEIDSEVVMIAPFCLSRACAIGGSWGEVEEVASARTYGVKPRVSKSTEVCKTQMWV